MKVALEKHLAPALSAGSHCAATGIQAKMMVKADVMVKQARNTAARNGIMVSLVNQGRRGKKGENRELGVRREDGDGPIMPMRQFR